LLNCLGNTIRARCALGRRTPQSSFQADWLNSRTAYLLLLLNCTRVPAT